MTAPRIALLGTGLMGAPMTRRLLGAGFAVTVWNRTRSKAEPLAADGAAVADAAADAVRGADVVITMLENGPIVGEVLFGAAGAAAAMTPGAVVLDMSSIPPPTAREHALRLSVLGLRHVDAPVSGGTRGAAEGTLAIMAGGAEETIAELAPVFAPLGRALRVGPSGSGQLAKLANQAIVGITIGAVSEALLLAASGGADPAAVREAIRGGFAESRILAEHGQRMIERDFLPGGQVRVHVKDLDTALAAASDGGVTLPLLSAVRDLFVALRDDGGAAYDHSALLIQLERMSGKRLGPGPDRLPG
ncbi:NAD(P)-dependent oxidoreductase [Methylopila henanensis]|uniref:NAD(P)-dependent oxidoreductase n=1 Tax=Methylopila henanensis TaxID=873516 RepID=A0ABW4KAC4_9HYPH